MSATLYDLQGFDPIATSWVRRRAARTRAGHAPTVGYRGGPLPGMPGRPGQGADAATTGWTASLMRWLSEMPRDMPPRG